MTAGDVPTLRTERLLLAIPGARAGGALARFNRENRQHLAPWNPAMTERDFDPAACAQRLDAHLEAARNGTRYSFLIFDGKADGQTLLGYLNFSEIVRGVFQACYMGYALSASAQGKGYMTEAARAGIDFIFSSVGLHRIMANYMPANARSGAVLKRLGFTIEGFARDYLYLAGKWQDHVLTSVTKPEH